MFIIYYNLFSDIGVVSNDGQHPPATGRQVELLSTGPMCRYAEDLAPALSVMAGEQAKKLRLDAKVNLFIYLTLSYYN